VIAGAGKRSLPELRARIKAKYPAVEFDGRSEWTTSFPANDLGLYDMVGNVWDWTEDCWHDSYDEAPADGSTWTSGDCGMRVVRGGSWYYNSRLLRSANRGSNQTLNRNWDLGFRVARTLLPP
jgi:formylglycine-generating enzyme required for sulfatase activity